MDEMNLPVYKVYVKTDVHGCIISVEGTAFHTEEELTEKGYVQIDEGTDGETYAHAQPNYIKNKYGKPAYDDEFHPNFKLVESTIEPKEGEEAETVYTVTELTSSDKEDLFVKPAQKAAKISEQQTKLQEMMLESQKTTFLDALPDEQALEVKYCYPEWSADGVPYKVGDRVLVDDELWKCRQAHTSQENWKPRIDTASLWERIDEQHAGTLEDPIPYANTMTVYNGKYYIEEGIIYKCIRDSGQPLYATCASLVGNYFEVA